MSKGFGYHGFPFDYWRFEENDMRYIFADFSIEQLIKDPSSPGVFIKARKPKMLSKINLLDYPVYSVVMRRKTKNTSTAFLKIFNSSIRITRSFLPLFIRSAVAKYIYAKR
ncbi:MAG: hypothetical protein HY762_04535 [Planctomycetes bacterium]|nr:hypothetical protein [Planctomycetota bacterium]